MESEGCAGCGIECEACRQVAESLVGVDELCFRQEVAYHSGIGTILVERSGGALDTSGRRSAVVAGLCLYVDQQVAAGIGIGTGERYSSRACPHSAPHLGERGGGKMRGEGGVADNTDTYHGIAVPTTCDKERKANYVLTDHIIKHTGGINHLVVLSIIGPVAIDWYICICGRAVCHQKCIYCGTNSQRHSNQHRSDNQKYTLFHKN